MRIAISLAAMVAASPAFAEDFLVRADISQAVIYASGAELIRQVELDMPAGQHRILIPADQMSGPLLVTGGAGATFGALSAITSYRVPENALDTDAQASARAAVLLAEQAVSEAQDQQRRAEAAIRAAEIQITYLEAIATGGADGHAFLADIAEIGSQVTALADAILAAEAALLSAQSAGEETRDALHAAETDLTWANATLADLRPFEENIAVWAIEADVAVGGQVALELTQRTARASWVPRYEMHLDTERGTLELGQIAEVEVVTNLSFDNVAVQLSTNDPDRPLQPGFIGDGLASIYEPRQVADLLRAGVEGSSVLGDHDALPELFAAPTYEPIGQSLGLSLTFDIPEPVSLTSGARVALPFGMESLDVDLVNRAVPRQDSTAFLVAEMENTTGRPILPGQAMLIRDGAMIGNHDIPLVANGSAVELPFGPLDHIQLTWTDLSRDTGDRGVFVNSSIELRRFEITAENLSSEPVELQLLYATPYSEQEELEIDVTSSLAPNDTAWEDIRGAYAWDLTLAPNADATIDLSFEFRWPEDQALNWRE
ncbi:MAG: mucoidy inhibitor MuiA family protein [Pseudomonadota bacterium]